MIREAIQGKSVGLVLSGGGVRGMAHIGLIKALNEAEVTCSQVSGSSVGALVGALYAGGYSPEEMLEFFKQTPLFKYNFFTLNKPGLFDTEKYYPVLRKYLPRDSFKALTKKLYVTVTNLYTGDEEVFSEGALILPLLASAALPPVFSPVRIGESLYADGGIMNNFPVEPIRSKSAFIIGSNVSVVTPLTGKAISSSMQLAQRTTSLMVYAINRKKLAECDFLFQPEGLDNIGVFDKKGMEKAFEMGYNHALALLEKGRSGVDQTSS